MAWFAVYESVTGKLRSTGTVVAPDAELAKKGLAKAALPFNPQNATKRWNETTRVFDDFVPPKGRLDVDTLLDRITPAEWEVVSTAARKHPNETVRDQLTAFLDYLRARKAVDLENAYLANVFSRLESSGLIGAGRAAVILAPARK